MSLSLRFISQVLLCPGLPLLLQVLAEERGCEGGVDLLTACGGRVSAANLVLDWGQGLYWGLVSSVTLTDMPEVIDCFLSYVSNSILHKPPTTSLTSHHWA